MLTAAAAPIGQWRLFHCYRDITDIAVTRDDVYALASGNLFRLHPADRSLTALDATSALSSPTAIAMIAAVGERLLVIYSDGALDIVTPSRTTFMPDIRDADITGSRRVNSVLADGTTAFLATDFGIVRLSTAEATVTDTYRLGTAVAYVEKDSRYLYAATPSRGLLRCPLTSNLLNPGLWEPCGPYVPREKAQYTADTYRHCLWAATPDGLTRFSEDREQTDTPLRPDGPAATTAWRLYLNGGTLWATAGIYTYPLMREQKGCIMTLRDGRWATLPEPDGDYECVNTLLFDPNDPQHFWATARTGLYEFRDAKPATTWDARNSTLTPMYNSPGQPTLVCSACLTPDGALWAMSGWCDNFLNRLSDGRWQRLTHKEATFDNRYSIDMQGAYYSAYHKSLFLVNCHAHNAALMRYDTDTDSLEIITPWPNEDGQTIALAIYYDIAEDAQHNLWIATDGGPVFITADDLGAHRYTLQQHKVPRGDGTGLADYLLTGLTVRRIVPAADGTVWIATAGNGLYHISADLNTELDHFTAATTPLPSDDIFDVLPDAATSEVWISTAQGLCAYQGDTRPSGTVMSTETVTAYPNPVPPEATRVTLAGLDPQTHIAFTTVSGRLLHQATAVSASYTWLLPADMPSGIILACLTQADGTAGPVVKIAVVR